MPMASVAQSEYDNRYDTYRLDYYQYPISPHADGSIAGLFEPSDGQVRIVQFFLARIQLFVQFQQFLGFDIFAADRIPLLFGLFLCFRVSASTSF